MEDKMFLQEKPEAFTILTLSTEYLDWSDRHEYAKVLRKYGYLKEANEIEYQVSEGDFYDMLHQYLNEYIPEFIH